MSRFFLSRATARRAAAEGHGRFRHAAAGPFVSPASQPSPAQPRPFCGRPPNTAPATKIRRPRRGVWGGLKAKLCRQYFACYVGETILYRGQGGEAKCSPKMAAGGVENRAPAGFGATSAQFSTFGVRNSAPRCLRELSGSFSGCFRSSKSVLGALGGAFRCHVRLQNGSSRRHLARRRMDACMGRSTKHACAVGIHNQTHTRWLR